MSNAPSYKIFQFFDQTVQNQKDVKFKWQRKAANLIQKKIIYLALSAYLALFIDLHHSCCNLPWLKIVTETMKVTNISKSNLLVKYTSESKYFTGKCVAASDELQQENLMF